MTFDDLRGILRGHHWVTVAGSAHLKRKRAASGAARFSNMCMLRPPGERLVDLLLAHPNSAMEADWDELERRVNKPGDRHVTGSASRRNAAPSSACPDRVQGERSVAARW